MSNNIKKNQNKINILESELNALRERMGVHNEKMNSIDNYLNKDMLDKKSASQNPSKDNSADFANFLERIATMNGGMNDFKDDEDYSESDDGSSVDEEDVYETEEEGEEESSRDDNSHSSSSSTSSSEEEESSEELEEEGISIPSVSEPEQADEPVLSDVKEPEPEPEPIQESVGLDDLLDVDEKGTSSASKPSVPIKKLDIGTVMSGKDGKGKYIVSLNKSGKKYWKKN